MQTRVNTGSRLHALLAIMAMLCSTCLCFIPVLCMGLLKLVPYSPWQVQCTRIIDGVVTGWCAINKWYIHKTQTIDWQIAGLDNLDMNNWYLVVANHQSWLDIVILQCLLNRKIPVLKFFIKDQLKWIPVLGFSWWAMGCPFMKRYSKKYLEKNPHKKGKDLDATRKAIEQFRKTPASIMNFLEGTRFCPKKHAQQNSPFTHLLKPKIGGISLILNTMGEQITALVDVTIIYPHKHSLWDFLCKRIQAIKIHVRQIPIPQQFTGSLDNNLFIEWLNAQWAIKDDLISSLK